MNLANMQQMINRDRRPPCAECGQDTRELYMVHDELWLSVMPTKNGFLHWQCLESRLGRKLASSDLSISYWFGIPNLLPLCNAALLADDWAKERQFIIKELELIMTERHRSHDNQNARSCYEIIEALRLHT